MNHYSEEGFPLVFHLTIIFAQHPGVVGELSAALCRHAEGLCAPKSPVLCFPGGEVQLQRTGELVFVWLFGIL